MGGGSDKLRERDGLTDAIRKIPLGTPIVQTADLRVHCHEMRGVHANRNGGFEEGSGAAGMGGGGWHGKGGVVGRP